MKRSGAVRIFVLMALVSGAAHASRSGPVSPKRAIQLDENALWAKKSAVQSLTAIAKKNANTPNEPSLLLRVAEMNEDIAAIQFRLAYARVADKSQADLTSYAGSMKAAIDPLNRLIAAYPTSPSVPRAYYLRSKAYSETGQVAQAIADLKKLVETWPKSKDAPVANMDLLRLLIQQKDYTVAIRYIERYGFRPEDKYYHSLLEKMSWCQFYLGAVPEAIRYTQQELKTVKGVERDKAISNYALFYATGVERKLSGVQGESVFEHFKTVASGKDLADLVISYAYLVRSKGLDTHLEALKASVMTEKNSETLKSDVLLITLENQYNRRQFPQLKATAEQEIALFQSNHSLRNDERRLTRVKNSFNDMVPGLQKLITTVQPDQKLAISSVLRVCYQFMLDSGKDNVEQARVHFNMAEVSLELHEYNEAAEHYRWVVKHLSEKDKIHRDLFMRSSVKSIEARYAFITDQGWSVKSLSAKPMSTSKGNVPEAVNQWIDWIDEFPKEALLPEKADAQAFEANRILYSLNQIERATKRLREFALRYPTSSYAVASASLVLDTYIASGMWQDAYDLTRVFAGVSEWKNSDFEKRIGDISSDVYYKVVEGAYREKKYDQTIQSAEEFLKSNPSSKRQNEMLELVANAALAKGDRQKASETFKRMLGSGPVKPEVTSLAYLTQASLSEEKFEFGDAYQGYRKAIESGAQVTDSMREKVLMYSWLNGDPASLNWALGNAKICPPRKAPAICAQFVKRFEETYAIRAALLKDEREEPSAIFKIADRGKLPLKTHFELLASLPSEWQKLDAVERAAVLPVLMDRIPSSVKAMCEQIRRSSQLRLDDNSISRRKHLIEKAQEAVEKLALLPVHKIRLDLTREDEHLYEDAAKDILAIRAPRGLQGPSLSEFKQALSDGASAFSKRAEELKSSEQALLSQRGALATPQQARRWSEVLTEKGDPGSAAPWFSAFKSALNQGRWQLAAFFVERLPESDPHKPYLQAALLSRAGATVEALTLLKEIPSEIQSQLQAGAKMATTQLNERAPASTKRGAHENQ